MKIRFLIVTVDNLAGTERAAVAQANALAGRHDVEVVSILRTANGGREDVDPRVRVRYLTSVGGDVSTRGVDQRVERAAELAKLPSTLVPRHWDPTLNALCDAALESYLPTTDADLVVTLTPGMLAAAAQRLPSRVALVHQEHRSSMHRQGGLEPLLAFAPRTDAVASLTEVNAAWLRTELGALAPPIHVVPNAAPGQEQPRSTLDRPLIVAAGRLENEKQHVQLIRAFALIADQIPEWRLRIFGTGYMRLGLIRAARRHGLYDRLELPGTTTDLAAEWATASISALTSYREGLPLVVQESFAAGVPVVAYDCPTGPSDLIEHGVNGYLVPLGEEQALAGHLLRLAQDRDLRMRLGEAARHSLDRFEQDRITAQWEEIYTAAVAGRRKGTPWVTRQLDATPAPTETGGPAPLVTPADSRREILRATAHAMAAIPDWFVQPAHRNRPPTFVVPLEHRLDWLAAIGTAGLPDHVSIATEPQDHWLVQRGSVARMTQELRSCFLHGLSIEPWPTDGAHVSHLRHAAGVRVEFWSRDAAGCLVGSRHSPFGRRVDPAVDITETVVDTITVPGLRTMQGPFVDQVRFPVDAVYTWVDDNDLRWRADRDAALERANPGQTRREAAGNARYRNRDELRYSLRSIHLFAPWIRRIHVITAGQRPAWLLDDPRVSVVDHREILPADALPTFNSHAIETALHRVPGLSEHFLYFNDDMFLARPLEPEHFFAASGTFAAFMSKAAVGIDGRDDRPFIAAAFQCRKLIQERFGLTLTQTFTHLPYPLRISVMEQMATEFPEAMERTAHSRFRSDTDVSPTSSLAQHLGLITGQAYYGDLNLEFVDMSRGNLRQRLQELLVRDDFDSFCLGDHHDYALPEARVVEFLEEFYSTYFPVRPPWESQTP